MIFIDTGAFVARSIPSDQYHRLAQAGWQALARNDVECFTNVGVLYESARLLIFRLGAVRSLPIIRSWFASDQLNILRPELELELESLNLVSKFADQRVGFVDAISFCLMQKYGIEQVFGFDQHFAFAGFELWPPKGRKK